MVGQYGAWCHDARRSINPLFIREWLQFEIEMIDNKDADIAIWRLFFIKISIPTAIKNVSQKVRYMFLSF